MVAQLLLCNVNVDEHVCQVIDVDASSSASQRSVTDGQDAWNFSSRIALLLRIQTCDAKSRKTKIKQDFLYNLQSVTETLSLVGHNPELPSGCSSTFFTHPANELRLSLMQASGWIEISKTTPPYMYYILCPLTN